MAIAATAFSAAPALAQTSDSAEAIIAQNDGAKFIAQTDSARPRFSPLSAEQKSKLGQLRDQYVLSTATKKAELQVASRQLKETMHGTTVDKSAALSLQSKINGLKGELSTARLNMMLASSDVFTPEQREQMQKFHKMRGHHGKHRGGCGMRGRAFGPGFGGPKFGGPGPRLSMDQPDFAPAAPPAPEFGPTAFGAPDFDGPEFGPEFGADIEDNLG